MSTMELIGVGWKAARQARREQRSRTAGVARRRGQVLTIAAEHGLTILAGGCFTAAAAMVAIPLGLAVAGVALLVLELRAGDR
jgi:hypothetical protein